MVDVDEESKSYTMLIEFPLVGAVCGSASDEEPSISALGSSLKWKSKPPLKTCGISVGCTTGYFVI